MNQRFSSSLKCQWEICPKKAMKIFPIFKCSATHNSCLWYFVLKMNEGLAAVERHDGWVIHDRIFILLWTIPYERNRVHTLCSKSYSIRRIWEVVRGCQYQPCSSLLMASSRRSLLESSLPLWPIILCSTFASHYHVAFGKIVSGIVHSTFLEAVWAQFHSVLRLSAVGRMLSAH